jgi:hypothetical protein
VQQAAERAQSREEASDPSVAEDIAALTSRTLLRTFKAFMMLALLSTACVGAGMAFKLGTTASALLLHSRVLTRRRRARRGDARVQAAVRR